MQNINVMRSEISTKLRNNEKLTREDVTAAAQVAQRSQHMSDKVQYVHVKAAYNTQGQSAE